MKTTKRNRHFLDGTKIVYQKTSLVRNPLLYNITQLGYAVCGENWVVSRYKYSAFLLMYVELGAVQFTVDDKELIANTGDLIFFDMMKKHTLQNPTGDAVHIQYMYLYGPNLAKIHSAVCHGENYILHGYDPTDFISSVNEISKNICCKREDVYDTSAMIYRILTNLMSQYQNHNSNDVLSEIIRYLENNYTHNHSVDKLAEMAHMSKYYFIRQFHSRTGSSPKEFITNIRLSRSKDMLTTSSRSVLDIATAVGFPDSRALISLYRSRLDCTPAEYRERYKK